MKSFFNHSNKLSISLNQGLSLAMAVFSLNILISYSYSPSSTDAHELQDSFDYEPEQLLSQKNIYDVIFPLIIFLYIIYIRKIHKIKKIINNNTFYCRNNACDHPKRNFSNIAAAI